MRGTKMGKGCGRFLALLVLFSAVLSAKVFAESLGLDRWSLTNLSWPGSDYLHITGVTYGNDTFVAVGDNGAILTSSDDGVSWTYEEQKDEYCCGITFGGVTYGNGTFVAVGWDGAILTSSDGKSWENRGYATNEMFRGVAYGDSTFVVVGEYGGILVSSGGASWVKTARFSMKELRGVAYGNNTFVAVGWCRDVANVGIVLTSSKSNGTTVWTSQTVDYVLYGVAYGGGTFVAVGYDGNNNGRGAILTSSDGSKWDVCEGLAATSIIRGITYGNNMFVAVGSYGTILTSPDWTLKASGTSERLCGVTYGNNTFVAVGQQGIILQSDPVVFPVISVSPTSLDFDSVKVGSSSSKTITVKNTGSADLVIGAVSTNLGDFTGDFIGDPIGDTCYTRTIASGKSGEISAIFSPKSEGVKTADLLISSNDPYNSTVTISLSGRGLPAPNQPPTVGLGASPVLGSEPLKVDFVANAYDTDGVVVKYLWNFDSTAGFCDSYNTTGCSKVSYTYKKAGTYNPKVVVTDDDGATAEKSMTIKVTPSPDLKIYDIYSDSKRRLCIRVGNVGTVEAGATYLDIWLDKGTKPKWTYKLSSLKSNDVRIIQPPVTLSGKHTIKAVIDPKGLIKEVDESNNTKKKTIDFK